MRHPKLALAAVLAASMTVLMPAAAAHATSREPSYRMFSGYTYPGNPGGLAACEAYGTYLEESGGWNDFFCILNMPDPGMYGLYMAYIFPGP